MSVRHLCRLASPLGGASLRHWRPAIVQAAARDERTLHWLTLRPVRNPPSESVCGKPEHSVRGIFAQIRYGLSCQALWRRRAGVDSNRSPHSQLFNVRRRSFMTKKWERLQKQVELRPGGSFFAFLFGFLAVLSRSRGLAGKCAGSDAERNGAYLSKQGELGAGARRSARWAGSRPRS